MVTMIASRALKPQSHSIVKLLVTEKLPRRIYSAPREEMEPWRIVEPLGRRLHQLPQLYGTLSKLKLSSLVVATTVAGFELSPSSGDITLLGWTAAGVALSSFAANSFNQWLEAPFDSQMTRTRMRPLPTIQISNIHTFNYGVIAGVAGVTVLALKVGWVAALLSGFNIALYAAAYTPLKRVSIINTWLGAVVGAIPPMIGFIAGNNNSVTLGCVALGAVLYCWQFPHFNSLSWNLRGDYARAGYCMASVINPKLTLNSALRHAIALIPLSGLLVYADICGPWLAVDSTFLNAGLILLSYRFRKEPNRKTARGLFFYSLFHLPLLLVLMVAHRKSPPPRIELDSE